MEIKHEIENDPIKLRKEVPKVVAEVRDDVKKVEEPRIFSSSNLDLKIEIIPAHFAKQYIDKIDIHGSMYGGEKLNGKLLDQLGLLPIYKVYLDGQSIRFSRPFKIEGRLAILGYLNIDGQLVPRTFYLSNSHGLWKILSHYDTDHNGRIRHYGKGIGEESIVLPMELQKLLAELSSSQLQDLQPDDAEFVFAGTARDTTNSTFFARTPGSRRLTGNFYGNHRPEDIRFDNHDEEPDLMITVGIMSICLKNM